MSDFRVALTFDAEYPSRRQCPPGNAERILETLRAHQVSASFFIQGRWATAYPTIARAIVQGGHLVGNHSHSHAPMPDLSDTGLIMDIDEAEASIRAVTGSNPRPWFRCLFGAGWEDARVLGALRRRGYRNTHWDVDAADWDDEQTAPGVSRQVERLRARNPRFVGLDGVGDGA